MYGDILQSWAMLLIKGKNILTDGTLALLIFDRNLIPMPFPVMTRILSISVSQTCGNLILDSTHHFFGKVCTKSGPLRFSPVFRLLTDFVCLYTYEFCLSLWKIARSVNLFLPLSARCRADAVNEQFHVECKAL